MLLMIAWRSAVGAAMRVGQSRRLRAFLLTLAAACAPAQAVVNGTPDGSETFLLRPVGIFDGSYLPPECNGIAGSNFLISPEWVLTTTPCLDPYVAFPYLIDVDACGGAGGVVFEEFTYPNSDVHLLHLHNTCDLHLFVPFALNDGVAPSLGMTLYDTGWGGGRKTGTTTVTAKSGIGADEIAFTGPNLFCTGTGDEGGPHWDYGSNGFPVAYAIFDRSDAGCSQYNISIRIDALIAFITGHVGNVCLSSNPTGPSCDGVFRNGLEPALN